MFVFMLTFNSKGLLVPNLNIQSSISELKNEFVDNIPTDKRKILFNNFIEYSRQLKVACNNVEVLQWIDGSFTTKIPYPDDIDLVTFIDYSVIEPNEALLNNYKFPQSVDIFVVDAYIVKVYPDNHLKYPLFIGDRSYWMDRFDRTRRNRAGNRLPKGFLEIKN